MKKKLVIVESPTKARTISRFLGKGFVVESSYGHIRDLPSYSLGIDIENNFEPKYVISRKVQPQVKKLKELVKKSDTVILATDEDREGEAIAWHLVQALNLKTLNLKHNTKKSGRSKKKPTDINSNLPLSLTDGGYTPSVERIVFHEITKKAIENALEHPREIDMHLVNAQQARRVLDRIVGYKLSPFLWKKVVKGLSAGRVQSVAVRLIADRETERNNFKPEEYWSIAAHFSGEKPFEARLHKIGEKNLQKLSIPSQKEADNILRHLEAASYIVASVEKKATERNPLPPFTTSTLQQDAARKFGYSAQQTMRIAQQLYEGIDIPGEGSTGLITYMRTDSLSLSPEALEAAKTFLSTTFGSQYALPSPRRFKTKSKGAQEAHEAVRPTHIERTPESIKNYLEPRQFKLYQLIWQRFLATQMPPAVFDATTVDVEANTGTPEIEPYTFRANGSILKFDGFLKVYPTKTEDSLLPNLVPKETLELEKLVPEQHFTEPPARYSEATLIKTLEKFGIGRPSTYAPTLSTIQNRGYVLKNSEKRFEPTEIGIMVNNLLVEHFPQIVNIQFTAKMEEDLDTIAEGGVQWKEAIAEFYGPFEKLLSEKYETVKKKDLSEETDEVCEKCGKPMVIKQSRFGKFMACSGFPDCRNIKKLSTPGIGISCPKCKEGEMGAKRTRRGKIFYGCSRYPECAFAVWNKPTGETCPECSSPLVEKGNKISCSNKECKYTGTRN